MSKQARAVEGLIIVITGASSGIGEEAAKQLARQGATVCLVARREEELARVKREIDGAGSKAAGAKGRGRARSKAFVYPADLSDNASVEACCDAILAQHKCVDVLVNNAGRSIRRPLRESLDRPHDFERTMQLNYFAAMRMTLRLLGPMLERGSGQIINVSSVAALMSTPRFSAYIASKAALDAFSRSLRIELNDSGIAVTTLNYPLVKTAMTEPTKIYKYLPQMDVADAAGWIVDAVKTRPARRTTHMARAFNIATAAAPGPSLQVLGQFYSRMLGLLQKRITRIEQKGS
ncbi:SDR family NAD(P)-dependent oxidoreductase [Nevskia soli]|uniref:SDR family NAD(P)-dependent oxidoreductase n=1 Tax=Nevskia soli TaxID=418856 RepID=UPI0004A735CA|nr:SDR family NAD(P)-dependent oxidoreductase [Nevskia soli]